jgi:UDP-N-acetyl-D-mannosaminuronic acid transferase (WecB/TagA/CpsF family)
LERAQEITKRKAEILYAAMRLTRQKQFPSDQMVELDMPLAGGVDRNLDLIARIRTNGSIENQEFLQDSIPGLSPG